MKVRIDKLLVERGRVSSRERAQAMVLSGKTCIDIGAPTSAFTDCMLQHGPAEVVAVDTGYGQIHAPLRSDPRVKLLEKTNARYLTEQDIARAGAAAAISFIAIDVSFISVTLVLPAVLE